MIELSQSTSRRGSLSCVRKPSDYYFDSKVNAWRPPLGCNNNKGMHRIEKIFLATKEIGTFNFDLDYNIII